MENLKIFITFILILIVSISIPVFIYCFIEDDKNARIASIIMITFCLLFGTLSLLLISPL